MRRLKTGRRPPIYPKTPGHLPCSSLTQPLPLSSRRPSVSFGGFGLREDYLRPLADKDSVRAKWRPLVRGIQHEEGWYTGTCTIGFVTERDDVEGLVIASHCTNEDGDIGGLDDADVHQPNDPLFGSNIVAEETIDPVLTNIDYDQCPSGWNCRFSDAAFAELDSDESLDLVVQHH